MHKPVMIVILSRTGAAAAAAKYPNAFKTPERSAASDINKI